MKMIIKQKQKVIHMYSSEYVPKKGDVIEIKKKETNSSFKKWKGYSLVPCKDKTTFSVTNIRVVLNEGVGQSLTENCVEVSVKELDEAKG